MRSGRTTVGAALLGAALLLNAGGGRTAPADDPKPKDKPETAKAEKAVKAELEKLKGSYGTLTRIKSAALARAMPGHVFFGVLYKQFPVGRMPPMGLKPSNLFVYGPEGKVHIITDNKKLTQFFKDRVVAGTDDDRIKDATRAWLRAAEELVQDGFYRFQIQDDDTKVAKTKGGKIAIGKSVAMKGGSGFISARLSFNAKGKLTNVSQDTKVNRGPRPRCQATKLLDADPVVRAMAEDDLLIMGRLAKPYLDEQRAKASPELRKAIDRMWQRILKDDR
jgi:hypothetical protein